MEATKNRHYKKHRLNTYKLGTGELSIYEKTIVFLAQKATIHSLGPDWYLYTRQIDY